MAASTSTRIQASDLNGPIHSSYRDDPNFERRERRPSPSYEAGVAPSRERRQTPERALGQGYGNSREDNEESYHRNGHAGGYGGQQQQQQPRRNNPYMGNGSNRGGDYFAGRRAQRDASTLSIWPVSPKTPRDDSDDSEVERSRKKRKKHDKKSHKSSSSKHKKRSSRYSDDSDSDSEDDRRKSKKKKSSSRKHRDDSESDEEYERRKRRKEKKSRSKKDRSDSRSKSPIDRVRNEQEEDEWAEKGAESRAVGDARLAVATAPADKSGLTSSKGKGKEAEANNDDSDDDDDDDVGPKPLAVTAEKSDPREFGGALLRGEGEAMAAFVADGQRIPRRGEIGMESNEIEKFESVGYVMSGSRHRRMNAVRIRKENQVISAEEKRGILKLQMEEKNKKEAMIVGSFKELVERRLEGERKISEKRAGRRDDDDE